MKEKDGRDGGYRTKYRERERVEKGGEWYKTKIKPEGERKGISMKRREDETEE